MTMVRCKVRPGAGTVAVSVSVKDINNVPTFLSIQHDFVTRRHGQTYLPIGVVYKDREKSVALIEFPVEADSGAHRIWVLVACRDFRKALQVEADSGAHRIWVPLSSLLEMNEVSA